MGWNPEGLIAPMKDEGLGGRLIIVAAICINAVMVVVTVAGLVFLLLEGLTR